VLDVRELSASPLLPLLYLSFAFDVRCYCCVASFAVRDVVCWYALLLRLSQVDSTLVVTDPFLCFAV
jgi:hypothetical protein